MKTFMVAAGLALAVSAPAAAQQSANSNWRAWIGCWTSAPIGDVSAPIVCVTPLSSPDAVELATIVGDKVVGRDTLDASGQDRAISTPDCSGAQNTRWSADQRRVFLKSTIMCGSQKTTTTAILSMTPTGEWLDVRGVRAGEGENVRVAEYRPVVIPPSVMDQFPASLRSQLVSAQGARVAAAAPMGTSAVIEASKTVDAAVVEAWLLEQGNKFDLDARMLITLADAGVPARVTDAMVAVSNPKAFEVARSGDRVERLGSSRGASVMMTRCDGFGYNDYNRYGYGSYYDAGCYGNNRYGYGSYGYSGLGYSGYGYGSGYGYRPPIVIVTGGTPTGNPQMVRGRGYTQNDPGASTNQSSGGRERSASSGSPSTSSPSPSNSSAGSSSESGSSSTQRTAKPRDP